jgi:arylsulfatase A
MMIQRVDRRNFLKSAAALGALAAFPLHAASSEKKPKRPNIILIMADDLGYECIGANGGTSYKTPVLDDLAKTGVRFEHCCSQPLCTPSRVQIMTGMYNVRNYKSFGVLDREQKTFAHILKDAGYATCIAGKWQLGNQADAGQHFGFDEACLWQHTVKGNKTDGHDNRYANPTIDINGKTAALPKGSFGPDVCTDFICDFVEKNKEKPFLVYYPMILTHCPFVPTPDSEDWDPESSGSKSYKGDAKYFGDMVTYMDKIVGRIAAKLEDLNLRENTLLLFTGDNGTDRPIVSKLNGRDVAAGKGKMTDAGTRVPLIASWPGIAPKGKILQDLVTLPRDGRSFLPQLKGDKGNPRDWIYCWYARKGGATGKAWARTQRYKLYNTGSFFDISEDVHETTPLTDLSPEVQKIRDMLQLALDKYKDTRNSHLKI